MGSSKGKSKAKDPVGGSLPFASPLTAAHTGQEAGQRKHRRQVKKKTTPGRDLLSDREEEERRKRREAKRARLEREQDEEDLLTSSIFGSVENGTERDGSGNFLDRLASTSRDEGGHSDDKSMSAGLFQIDRSGEGDYDKIEGEGDGKSVWKDSDDEAGGQLSVDDPSDEEDDDKGEPKAAWDDSDDEQVAVSLVSSTRIKKLRKTLDETQPLSGKDYEKRLRERYQKTAGAAVRTDWADIGALDQGNTGARQSDDSDSDEGPSASSILASTTSLFSTASRLPPNILKIVRSPDANLSDPNKSVVSSVQFHPGADPDAPLLLTAGLDKTLRFFRIDGDTNEKVHGIHFPNFPIYSASFLGDGGNVIVSGRRPHFYIYDAVAGKVDRVPGIPGREERSLETMTVSPNGKLIAFAGNDGYIILVEAKSKLWVADLKMNGSARAVTFSHDGAYIIASGGDGEIYKWDIRTKRCFDRFKNEDGTPSSSLSASARFLAVGAESGVVNVYNNRGAASSGSFASKRQPVKSVMNLQTSADYVKFNHDGQILAMASRREKNSMKLLHIPSQTVFSNWPTSKTPLNYVWSMDFSPGSKYMTMGNDQGKCLLYRLPHYDDQ